MSANYSLLCYTREATGREEANNEDIAYSMHLALRSGDDAEWQPLNENYGIFFAAGVVVGDSKDETLKQWGRLKLLKVSVSSGEDGSDTVLKARILDRGVNVGVDEPVEREVSGIGNGPIAAFLNAVSNFGIEASVMDYVEHTMSVGTDAMAASYVECQIGEEDNTSIVWGVGIDTSIVTSSLKAIISAINRSER